MAPGTSDGPRGLAQLRGWRRVLSAVTGCLLVATGTPGTGLANLRERLQLAFGGDAQVRLGPFEPRSVWAEMEFPARRSAA